jgi:hypothetical protein
MQKRSTLANNWPDNYTEDFKFRPEQLACMQDFLKTYQYKRVWENDFFKIYTPSNKIPSVSENRFR